MPFEAKSLEGPAPSKPHLLILTDDSGLYTAIPPGAVVLIVENPSKLDSIFPMVLHSVNHKVIRFRCACGRQGCNRLIEYRASMSGHHQQSSKASKQAFEQANPALAQGSEKPHS